MAEDKGLSLLDYAKKQRRKDCPVCALPVEIRQQMAGASEKKIKRIVVLSWLADAHGITVSPSDMMTHVNGHHDS